MADRGKCIDHLFGFAIDNRVRLSIAATDPTSYNAKVADSIAIGSSNPATFSPPVDAAP